MTLLIIENRMIIRARMIAKSVTDPRPVYRRAGQSPAAGLAETTPELIGYFPDRV